MNEVRLVNRTEFFQRTSHDRTNFLNFNSYNLKPLHQPYTYIFKDFYHFLIDLKWWILLASFSIAYSIFHLFFGVLYYFGGPGSLGDDDQIHDFGASFFFSVQTFTTIGYGHAYPKTVYVNLLVFIESWISIFIQAFILTVMIAKVQRPTLVKRSILFSKFAVVQQLPKPKSTSKAPDEKYWSITFRFANMRSSQIIDPRFHLLLLEWNDVEHSKIKQQTTNTESLLDQDYLAHNYQNESSNSSIQMESADEMDTTLRDVSSIPKRGKWSRLWHGAPSQTGRQYKEPRVFELDYQLNVQLGRVRGLEYSSPFLNMPYTVTHYIDESSPLQDYLHEYLSQSQTLSHFASPTSKRYEMIAVLDAIDESSSHNFQARFSYTLHEMLFNCSFAPVTFESQGKYYVDYDYFHQVVTNPPTPPSGTIADREEKHTDKHK